MRRRFRSNLCFFVVGCLLLGGLLAGSWLPVGVGAEPAFVPALDMAGNEFEAIQDVETGLMWGKDIGTFGGVLTIQHMVDIWADGTEDYLPDPDETGGYWAYSEENPTGWRAPTAGEFIEARNHGLAGYLDFDYAQGFQGVNDAIDPDSPDSDFWGDVYFWTDCMGVYRGNPTYAYEFRFSDGNCRLAQGGNQQLAVRGAPPDHSLCPSGCLDSPIKNKGTKPPKK